MSVNINKTKIIEVIGPPGIGKSTFYKALCEKWNSESNWIYQDQLLSDAKPPITQLKSWGDYQFRKFINKKSIKNIPIDFGLRFVENNNSLAQYLWQHLNNKEVYSNKEIDKKFRSAFFLFRDFCRYQAIWESKSSKPCIIDEGLFVKSFFILPDKQLTKQIIDQLFAILSLPHAIIYINTLEVNIIAERLLNRKKIIASQIGKGKAELLDDIENWQYLFSLIVDNMKQYNVPVYHIDGLKPIEYNVNLLNNMLG